MLLLLSEEQEAKIKSILNEDVKKFDHYLQLLETWMDRHQFIPKNYDKRMLPIFLRSSKCDLEKTKNKLQLYFVYKKRFPDMFSYYTLKQQDINALNNAYLYESCNVTPEGYRVGCLGFRSSDTTDCDMSVLTKLLAMFCTYKSTLDTINAGIVIVINLTNLTPSIATSFVNPTLYKLIELLQKVYPFRVKAIYITSLPGFAVSIANMLKMCFGPKIRNRIIMESGDKQMRKSIPKNCLPIEYDGTDGSIEDPARNCNQILQATKPWFMEQEKIQIVGDVPKEIYVASGIDEDAGTQGSFRKLDID